MLPCAAIAGQTSAEQRNSAMSGEEPIRLGAPGFTAAPSVEKALRQRRSVREYSGKPLTLEELSQLLWAAQGVTGRGGERTAPSAGALYPLQLYLAVGDAPPLKPGVYAYRPADHALERIGEGDRRTRLADAALGQACVGAGAVVIVFAANYGRTTRKYGERGIRYVDMEAGHAAQNVYLEAASLRLGTVVVGAFDDDRIKGVLQLPKEERPLSLMPVGRLR